MGDNSLQIFNYNVNIIYLKKIYNNLDQTQIIQFNNIVPIAMLSLYFIKYIIKNINLICTDFYDFFFPPN